MSLCPYVKPGQQESVSSALSSAVVMFFFFLLQPTTTVVTKKSKSAKQGSDDITLPLMDKTQGQQIIPRVPSEKCH